MEGYDVVLYELITDSKNCDVIPLSNISFFVYKYNYTDIISYTVHIVIIARRFFSVFVVVFKANHIEKFLNKNCRLL